MYSVSCVAGCVCCRCVAPSQAQTVVQDNNLPTNRYMEEIRDHVNSLMRAKNDASAKLFPDGRFLLLKPNAQFTVDARSYGEYLYWPEQRYDYERCFANPTELPQWGNRSGFKVRVFGAPTTLFPSDRVGLDPRNGHFFPGYGPAAGGGRVTLFTTEGATRKTRAKLGLLILTLLGRGPEESQNHAVVRNFLREMAGTERHAAPASVEELASSWEEDPWDNSETQIDLPDLYEDGFEQHEDRFRHIRYSAKVTHYHLRMDRAANAQGVWSALGTGCSTQKSLFIRFFRNMSCTRPRSSCCIHNVALYHTQTCTAHS